MNKAVRFTLFPGGSGNKWLDHAADGLMSLKADVYNRCFQNVDYEVFLKDLYIEITSGLYFWQYIFLAVLLLSPFHFYFLPLSFSFFPFSFPSPLHLLLLQHFSSYLTHCSFPLKISLFIPVFKTLLGGGKMVESSSQGLIPSNHTVVHNHPHLQFQEIRWPLLAPTGGRHTGSAHTSMQARHTYIKLNK